MLATTTTWLGCGHESLELRSYYVVVKPDFGCCLFLLQGTEGGGGRSRVRGGPAHAQGRSLHGVASLSRLIAFETAPGPQTGSGYRESLGSVLKYGKGSAACS